MDGSGDGHGSGDGKQNREPNNLKDFTLNPY